MANVQISQLPAALPLDGTELVPVVQGGVTVRTTTAAVAGSPSQQQTFLTVNQEPTLPNSRRLTADPGISITDGGPLSTLNLELTGTAASLNTAAPGIIVKDAGGNVVSRSVAVSGVGLSVSNGSGVAGNPTVSLTGQIENFASATATGLVTLTSGGAVSATSIQGTAGRTTVTNGNGIAGAPIIDLSVSGVIPGTYGGASSIPVVTVDAYGRLTTVGTIPIAAGGTVTQIDTGLGLTGGPITASGTISIDPLVVATLSGTQTFSNKTISGVNNTLTNIGNSSLVNSALTVNGTNISLGGSGTVTAASPYSLTFGTGLNGSPYNGSSAITVTIDSSVVTLNGSQTLTNKTISGATNTLTSIGNSSLTNSSVTFNGVSVALGSSGTITAASPNALTIGTGLTGTSYNGSAPITIAIDSTVATLTGIQTLTNKSISGATNTLSSIPNSALDNSSVTIGTTNVALGGTASTLGGLTSVAVTQDPVSNLQLATKQYVDNIAVQGTYYHAPVKYETASPLTATYNQPGGPGVGVGATLTNAGTLAAFAPDGPTASVGDRILVYKQANQVQNGIYTVTTVGDGSTAWVLTRATDADTYGLINPNALGQGDAFFVTSGNTGAGETYVCNTVGTITFGTTNITFVQISDIQVYSAGTGLTLSGTQFSITNTGVSAASYGSASSVPVLAINAQGQITSASNTSIAIDGNQITSGTVGSSYISGSYTGITGVGTLTAGTWNATPIANSYLANSSITINGSSVSLGNSVTVTATATNVLTFGTHLTGTSYNGSAPITIGTDATDANTASTIVARDASGNFSAGTITASLNGNASTATTAATATDATNVATTATSTNTDFYIPFVPSSSTGNQALGVDAGLKYNPSTNAITGGISGGTF